MNNHLKELLNKKISENVFNSIGYEEKVNFPLLKYFIESGESVERVTKKGSESYLVTLEDIESIVTFIGEKEIKNLNSDTEKVYFELKKAYEKLKENDLWEHFNHSIQKTIIDKFLIEYLYLDYVKFQNDFILDKIYTMLKDESEKINVSMINQSVIEIEKAKFDLKYKVNIKNIFNEINNEMLMKGFENLIQSVLDENIEVVITSKH